MQVRNREKPRVDVSSKPPRTPSSSNRSRTPPLRALTAAALVLLMSLFAISLSRAIQEEADLLRYRSAARDLASTIRAMGARALAGRCTMQLRPDPVRNVFQLTAVRGASRPYETVEQTIWLPDGLEISGAPPPLTAFPTGRMSAALIVATAPVYNRLFRLTINERGGVQLDEEPIL